MTNLLSIILIFATSFTEAPSNIPRYDEIKIFDFACDRPLKDILFALNNRESSCQILKEKSLPSTARNLLTHQLTQNKSYGGDEASCFDPHLGIVFYHKEAITGYISVCLSCSRSKSSFKIDAANTHIDSEPHTNSEYKVC